MFALEMGGGWGGVTPHSEIMVGDEAPCVLITNHPVGCVILSHPVGKGGLHPILKL